MTEEWRAITGYEGAYEVSDQGRVRSLVRRGRREELILAQKINTKGYPAVTLSLNNVQRLMEVHWLVTEAFLGPRPHGMETRHLNGRPLDARLANLRYGTPKENQRDRHAHGTAHRTTKGVECDTCAELRHVMIPEPAAM